MSVAHFRGLALALAACLILVGAAGCGADDDSTAAPERRASTPTPSANAAMTGSPAASVAPSVVPPAEFSQMYESLGRSLDAWEQALKQQPTAPNTPIFGAHLLVANANRGVALLAPATLQAIDGELVRFQQLGIKGMTVSISFPILNADFPRSSEYLDFYAAVAQKVRAHNMTFTVEQHVIFGGTAFTNLTYDYSKLPFEQFIALFRTMSQTIIDRLHPDYLTLLSEPDTFGKLTGYKEASTPWGAADFIAKVVQGLNRGTTKLGAGASSWLPNAADYDVAFARVPLDYLDLHIYPVNGEVIGNLAKIVAISKSAGKPLVLDEAWLYKVGPNEISGAGFDQPTEAFRRDVYSFWQPLDARFLQLAVQFARANNIAYVAPFWTTLFFAYTDYTTQTKDLSYQPLAQLTNQSANAAIKDGTFSATGKAYGAAIGR